MCLYFLLWVFFDCLFVFPQGAITFYMNFEDCIAKLRDICSLKYSLETLSRFSYLKFKFCNFCCIKQRIFISCRCFFRACAVYALVEQDVAVIFSIST